MRMGICNRRSTCMMPDRMEPARRPFDLDGRGPGALDLPPHLGQHGGQVLDLGLPGGVLDDGGARRPDRCTKQSTRSLFNLPACGDHASELER